MLTRGSATVEHSHATQSGFLQLSESLRLLLDGIVLERRRDSLLQCRYRVVETCEKKCVSPLPRSVSLPSLTLRHSSRRNLSQFDQHEVAQLFDVLGVVQTGQDAAQEFVNFNLLEARVEKRVHAFVGGL